MNQTPNMGMNRTGIAMSPIDSAKMLELTDTPPPPSGDSRTAFAFRSDFIRSAEPLGSVPLPGSLKGAAITVLHKLKGDRPEVFLDKLGERIAFERTGVRLYDLLINKCREYAQSDDSGVSIEKLEQIRAEELEHFHLASAVMRQVGGDPTAVTPAADVAGVMSLGLIQILADPRTTVPQALEAILVAELTDNDAWPLLIELTQEQDLNEAALEFGRAQIAEERHLTEIRNLVAQALLKKDVVH